VAGVGLPPAGRLGAAAAAAARTKTA